MSRCAPSGSPPPAPGHRKPAEAWADNACPGPVCSAIRPWAGRREGLVMPAFHAWLNLGHSGPVPADSSGLVHLE